MSDRPALPCKTEDEAADAPDAAARLRFLGMPAAHAGHAPDAASVQTIETHMSWVFLVGDCALKLKKAVRYPFLDFSTLAAREFNCRGRRQVLGASSGALPRDS